MKNDAKFEEELTCHFKIDTTIGQNLTRAFKCLKNLHFNGLLLTKVYNVSSKQQRRGRINSSFTKGQTFPSFMTTKWSCG